MRGTPQAVRALVLTIFVALAPLAIAPALSSPSQAAEQPANLAGAPSVPILTVSPCTGRCDPAFRVTDTVTPTIIARTTDADSDLLAYTWQLFHSGDHTTPLVTATTEARAGVPAEWGVPPGLLQDEGAYDVKVTVSDGQAESTNAMSLGVDINNRPHTPRGLQLQPCAPCHKPTKTRTATPSVSADIWDDDSTSLEVRLEVRDPMGRVKQTPGSYADGQSKVFRMIPRGLISQSGEYAIRLGNSDGSGWVWSPWRKFQVALPPTSRTPTLSGVTPCQPAPCDQETLAATSPSLTPTLHVTPHGKPGHKQQLSAQFTVAPDDAGRTFDIGTSNGDSAPLSWTVPASLLGSNQYLVRVGSRRLTAPAKATNWGGWFTLTIDSETISLDTPTSRRVPGLGYPAGAGPVKEDPGSAEDQVQARATARTADEQLAWDLAPVMYLHNGVRGPGGKFTTNPEKNFPISINTFIATSQLWWAHNAGCADHRLDSNPTSLKLGTPGQYSHNLADSCAHNSQVWSNTMSVAPFRGEVTTADNGEGMYLDLPDSLRDGDGLSGNEPVYYLIRDLSPTERYVRYFFGYGDSATRRGSLTFSHHEGDWESIAVKVVLQGSPPNQTWAPHLVQYFFHHDFCVEPWSTSLLNSAGRVEVGVARDAHGSYPPGADPGSSGSGAAQRDDLVEWQGSTTKTWDARTSLSEATSKEWWGYGGGFGEAGSGRNTSGPWGPSLFRPEPTFVSQDCSNNP